MEDNKQASLPCGSTRKKLLRPFTVEYKAVGPMCSTTEMLTYLRSLKSCSERTIQCCQQRGNSFLVTFESADVVKAVLEGFSVWIAAKEFMVCPAGEQRTWVKIKDLPYDFDDGDVQRFLKKFGSIHKVMWDKHPGTNICNGDISVVMSLTQNIPRFLMCDDFEVRAFHKGQDVLCFYCRGKGHLIADCTEFICYKCKQPGHVASKCPSVVRVFGKEPGKVPVKEPVKERGPKSQAWNKVVANGKQSPEKPTEVAPVWKKSAEVMNGQSKRWSEQMDLEDESKQAKQKKTEEVKEDQKSKAAEQMDVGVGKKEHKYQHIVREAMLVQKGETEEHLRLLRNFRWRMDQLYQKRGVEYGAESYVPDVKLSDVEIVEFFFDNNIPLSQGKSMTHLRKQYMSHWMTKMGIYTKEDLENFFCAKVSFE